MKRLGILIMLIYGYNNLFPQDRISISFNFSPIVSNRILKTNVDSIRQNHSSTDSFIKDRDEVDKSQSGLKTGFNIFYEFDNGLICYSGLSYVFQRIKQSTIFPSGNYIYGGSIIPNYGNGYSLNTEFHYLSVPIGIKLKILTKNRIDIGINSGISFDYLIHSKSIVYKDPNTNVDNVKYNNFTSEMDIGFDCDYLINDRLSVFLRPNFNIFIFPNLKDFDIIRQYNYYYAFDFGIKYKINSH
jgi:hypothetical protein